MAQCFACSKEISYWSMVKGAFKHFWRNMIRGNLVVFDCPHCGVVCQETAVSYYSFILLFVAVSAGIIMVLRRMSVDLTNDWGFLAIFLVVFFAGSNLWWRTYARLKEPYIFWPEKE